MKTMITVVVMAVVTTIIAEEANTLDTYRQSYEKQQQAALTQYGKTLDTIMVNLKKKGDLDNVLILQSEEKRFDTEKTVPPPTDTKTSFRPASEAYHKSMVTLLEKYVTALDGLIKKETAADRIEEAKVIKTEKDKANFILADIQAKLAAKVVETKKQPEPTVDPSDSEKTAIKANTDKKADRIIGVWFVSFGNSAKRKYEFSDDGTFTMIELEYGGKALPEHASTGTWQWTKMHDHATVEVNETLDVWKRQGSSAWNVSHYGAKSNYPKGSPITGIARRKK